MLANSADPNDTLVISADFSVTAGVISNVRLIVTILLNDTTNNPTIRDFSDTFTMYINGYVTVHRNFVSDDMKNWNMFDNKTAYSNNIAYDSFFLINEEYNTAQEETLKTGDKVAFDY